MTLSKRYFLTPTPAFPCHLGKLLSRAFCLCLVLSQHLPYFEKVLFVCLLVYSVSLHFLEYKFREGRELIIFVQHFNPQSKPPEFRMPGS